MTLNFDAGLAWAGGIITALLGWLFRGHEVRIRQVETSADGRERRLQALELTVETKESAAAQRIAVRRDIQDFRTETGDKLDVVRAQAIIDRKESADELKEFREELSDRLETVRTEANTKLDRVSDQIGLLSSTLAKRSGEDRETATRRFKKD